MWLWDCNSWQVAEFISQTLKTPLITKQVSVSNEMFLIVRVSKYKKTNLPISQIVNVVIIFIFIVIIIARLIQALSSKVTVAEVIPL